MYPRNQILYQILPSVFGNIASASPTDPSLQNCRAEDYVTPQKFLDGAEIPTFYQFQSNLVTEEDMVPGMERIQDVDKRLTLPTRTHMREGIEGILI
jgi:cytochrome c oxidase subunit 2